MRVKNKEIRRRRHRKEQSQKGALREIKAHQGEKKPVAAKPKVGAKKPAAKSDAKKPSRAKVAE